MSARQNQKIKWRAEYKKATGGRFSPLTARGARETILGKISKTEEALNTYKALRSAKERAQGDTSRLDAATEEANKSLKKLREALGVLDKAIK